MVSIHLYFSIESGSDYLTEILEFVSPYKLIFFNKKKRFRTQIYIKKNSKIEMMTYMMYGIYTLSSQDLSEILEFVSPYKLLIYF
jgi:hypothetical protein